MKHAQLYNHNMHAHTDMDMNMEMGYGGTGMELGMESITERALRMCLPVEPTK